jgi:hypothetical protein
VTSFSDENRTLSTVGTTPKLFQGSWKLKLMRSGKIVKLVVTWIPHSHSNRWWARRCGRRWVAATWYRPPYLCCGFTSECLHAVGSPANVWMSVRIAGVFGKSCALDRKRARTLWVISWKVKPLLSPCANFSIWSAEASIEGPAAVSWGTYSNRPAATTKLGNPIDKNLLSLKLSIVDNK